MKNRVKNKLKSAIIQHMCEISFKSFLECNDDIYEIYESFGFEDNDFYDILEEIKNEALEHCDSGESCDDIPDICIIDDCKKVIEEIKEDDNKRNDYSIRNLYFKAKENITTSVKRFEYVYYDSSCTVHVDNIIIDFHEDDESNIKKLEDIKKEYAERFMYFLEHDILITDN